MVRSNRTIANLGTALDSGTSTEFLGLGDSGVLFEPVAYQDITGKPTVLDSASTIALFDSAYVQARQLGGGIDSAGVTGIVDSAYVQARKSGGGLDSAKVTNLIDSAYIAARVTSGLDSAGVTGLVDSSYVTDRFSANSGFDWYLYTATAGQTVFDSIDDNGETLSYSQDGILVFYNGILMLKTYDYTATDGTSVTLSTAADSGANVAIVKYGIGSSAGSSSSGPNADWYGDRGIFAGGYQGSGLSKNRIEYVAISTTGNSSDFGDLVNEPQGHAALTGDASTRGVFAGGSLAAAGNTIQYITTTTTGDATDFGDLITASSYNAGFSSGTRGVFQLGNTTTDTPVVRINTLEYITVATTGNATDFGDASSSVNGSSAGTDGAVGLVFGGNDGSGGSGYINTIDKHTIATPGNATDFGDLTSGKWATACCSNQTYAVVGGGYTGSSYINVLDYVTIASPGNATDFGDLISAGSQFAATANGTRGIFGGRFTGAAFTVAIDYITIASPGNASDFGDLLGTGYYDNAACSGNAS